MATGFPAVTGDILTAAAYNGLVNYTVQTNVNDTTAVLNDQYQVLELMSKATAISFNIPTNASVAFPIGTVITILNVGAGLCTIKAVTSGTTLIQSAGAVSAQPTLAQYKSAACIKTLTDTWVIVGAIA
jgi:Tfp pilus assembly protein PilE